MRSLAELVAGWLLRLREVSSGQLVVRLLMVLGGGGALLLAHSWANFFFGPALLALGVLALAGSLLFPDSLSGASLIALVVIWWLMAGGSHGLVKTAVLAAALGLFHLAAAWAAAGPSRAVLRGSLAGQMARQGLIYLLSVIITLAAIVAVATLLPKVSGGVIWLALAGVAVVGLGALVAQRRT